MNPQLTEALGYMSVSSYPLPCPDDVKARIAALRLPTSFSLSSSSTPVSSSPMNITAWRPGPGSGGSGSGPGFGGGGGFKGDRDRDRDSRDNRGYRNSQQDSRDEWITPHQRRQPFPHSHPSRPPYSHAPSHMRPPSRQAPQQSPMRQQEQSQSPQQTPMRRQEKPAHGGSRVPPPRFGKKIRTDVTADERIMDCIRDKMNKFSVLTYDATKSWLSELLNSGDTGFLTDFITLVFEKAASEPTFCALYAKLITELCVSFSHLIVDIKRIFTEFMDVFVDADVVENKDKDKDETSAAAYKQFLAFRERRRFRRGYAKFIGEIAVTNSAILSSADMYQTCWVILKQLVSVKSQEGKGIMCEEFADCLTSLVTSCMELLNQNPSQKSELFAAVKAAMTKDVSLTNKARFALMDITDLFSK